jgi:hypothetical protein
MDVAPAARHVAAERTAGLGERRLSVSSSITSRVDAEPVRQHSPRRVAGSGEHKYFRADAAPKKGDGFRNRVVADSSTTMRSVGLDRAFGVSRPGPAQFRSLEKAFPKVSSSSLGAGHFCRVRLTRRAGLL